MKEKDNLVVVVMEGDKARIAKVAIENPSARVKGVFEFETFLEYVEDHLSDSLMDHIFTMLEKVGYNTEMALNIEDQKTWESILEQLEFRQQPIGELLDSFVAGFLYYETSDWIRKVFKNFSKTTFIE